MTAFLEALPGRPPADRHGGQAAGRRRQRPARGRAVTDLVADYEAAGALCLSVVTGRWFGGTPDLLREVTARPGSRCSRRTSSPGRSQLADARDLGASAVLLDGRAAASPPFPSSSMRP